MVANLLSFSEADKFSGWIACIFTSIILIILIGLLFTQKRMQNRFTKIAYAELLFSFVFRTVALSLLSVKINTSQCTVLNSRLFDKIMFEIPYYLLVLIQFSLLFGWFSCVRVFETLNGSELNDATKISQRQFIIFTVVTSFITLVMALNITAQSIDYIQSGYWCSAITNRSAIIDYSCIIILTSF